MGLPEASYPPAGRCRPDRQRVPRGGERGSNRRQVEHRLRRPGCAWQSLLYRLGTSCNCKCAMQGMSDLSCGRHPAALPYYPLTDKLDREEYDFQDRFAQLGELTEPVWRSG